MRSNALAGAVLAALLGIGCSGQGGTSPFPKVSVGPVVMRVLKTAAVPQVHPVTEALTADDLAKDASIDGLASKIASFGYVAGRQRTFQGESRHLTLVVSRSLAFGGDTGASDFVGFVHDNTKAYFGNATTRALQVGSASGWLYSLPPCACHLAAPAFVAVVSDGSNVAWLEINGPDATQALLVRMLNPANSVQVR